MEQTLNALYNLRIRLIRFNKDIVESIREIDKEIDRLKKRGDYIKSSQARKSP